MTPRTLSAALKAGYIIQDVKIGNYGKSRVDVKPRFYNQGMKAVLSFWLSTSYVARNYPNSYRTATY